MVAMRVLDRKLGRDVLRLWAQALAVAMVMACGVATIILAVGAYRSLSETREAFYERYRFGNIFASVVRAPLVLKDRITAIPGVSAVEFRVVHSALLDVPGMSEPAAGLAVSVPDYREPAVNRVYIRKGRMPEPGRPGEVAVVETFATAHHFQPGDRFSAIMNGRKRQLTIVGIVLSPEYIYAIGPGDMVPDQRRFGVFFMSSKTLSGLFDMEGAFNNVSLTTLRDANNTRIIEALDRILKPYGGAGAYDRPDQISHAFLDSELQSLRAMATIVPPIFLFVSAFLVNMILSRLITLEREQVGLLKAVGYSNFAIGWHYAKLVIVIAIIGLAIGSGAGWWLGRGLTRLYAEFYSFPFLIFRQSVDLYLVAGGVSVASALAGAAKAIWQTASLPPAVAMRPPSPTVYKSFFGSLLRKQKLVSQLTIMALRHVIRWPVRSFLTTLGGSLSVALLVTALFTFDSINFMVDTTFFRADRQDATLSFVTDRGTDAKAAVAALPGVLRVEPFRITPVTLRHGHFSERMSIFGIPQKADLARILDRDLEPMDPPSNGIVLSERVAEKMKLRPGDMVDVELRERDNRIVRVPVSAIEQSYVGLTAHMDLESLDRLMLDGRRISGTRISIDTDQLGKLYKTIKTTPGISTIALQRISRERFRDTIEENITIMNTVYFVLAIIITFGVIYNSARIQLSERARELASLRVFGFTRAEVSSVLLVEMAVIVLAAQPLGWLLGYLFAWSVTAGFANDLFRVPLVVNPSTFAKASAIVLGAALVSALIVRRRVDRLDLIRVLKTRE
jgi:putative ABC transport system permease protein